MKKVILLCMAVSLLGTACTTPGKRTAWGAAGGAAVGAAAGAIIANNTGGVSGAGIRPIAVRMVWEACRAVDIPVVGMGGITCAEDALQFMMAGAVAVQVGTANFTDTLAMPKIIEGLDRWLDAHGVADINEIRGTLHL